MRLAVMERNEILLKYRELCSIVDELEAAFPERKFTIDGHLIGSIGEVIVAELYGLKLLSQTEEKHDATTSDGKFVQIKVTQTDKIALSSEPDFLIVIKMLNSGDWEEIYNGPGKNAWENSGKKQKNGQQPISLAKLKKLMEQVPDSEKIRKA